MKKTRLKLTTILILTALAGCKNADSKKDADASTSLESGTMTEEELYRPNFHFSPKKGWMNDPNGMFFYNEYYHLYFQHYPDSSKWGPMHWGHATSTDMVSWIEQPIALYPDELGYIFSGSAVVDHDNTSAFGKEGKIPIVAIFTYHDPKKEKGGGTDVETQGIAYSLDEGLTWTKYEGNPVIKNPGEMDFRDPKVSWDDLREQWVMVLAAGQKTMFYASQNLKDWQLLSDFGEGVGNHKGVWECPDLFPLQVKDSDEVKWVLLVSINPGGPNGGSATQYFVGDFDGKRFTLDPDVKKAMAREHDFWVDFGKDNYAGVTWSNVSTANGGKLFIGWMSNWQYANEVPTETWRSATTVAREIELIKRDDEYRLISIPVEEISGYRNSKYKKENISVKERVKLIGTETADLSNTEINFSISDLKDDVYTFRLSNRDGDELSFGYDHNEKSFYLDRSKSGKTDFSQNFANKVSTAPRTSNAANLTGKILLDKTSIELFYDDGETVMTEIFFPNAPFETLSIESEQQEFQLNHIEVHELNFN
jgi:levanase/fructan beta-fructosidase